MKKGFYSRLAWTGIRKNWRLYLPYLLTCVGMTAMYYIVGFLGSSPVVAAMRGGDTLQGMLRLGGFVLGLFTFLFLFYTNSFLIRRRKKEFGLYNILGMGKRNLAKLLLWESAMIAAGSLAAGLLLGILLSKLGELGAASVLSSQAGYQLSVGWKPALETAGLFLLLHALILLNSLCQLHLSNPIQLLHSENTGERPPKANPLLAAAGAVLLGAAYWLAVTIEEPVVALLWFFGAAAMVVAATYLLFVSGSVLLCRLLQRNKGYYYKTSHFISVSSMAYRMKRNGAGLASICILSTMVLVMLSATVCLYIGTEDSLRSRYPQNISVSLRSQTVEELYTAQVEELARVMDETAARYGQTPEGVVEYRMAGLVGMLQGEELLTDNAGFYQAQVSAMEQTYQVLIFPLEDYNRLTGSQEQLAPGEAILYCTGGPLGLDSLSIQGGTALSIQKEVTGFAPVGMNDMQIIRTLYLFVPDFQETTAPLQGLTDAGGLSVLNLYWYRGYDLPGDDAVQIQIQRSLEEQLPALFPGGGGVSASCEGVPSRRAEPSGTYGGLLYLGVLLGIVFLFAAVLIMYYKQIVEGYEDQARFSILQKVGMTRREIRKSINSQVLTVFFLPLAAAGIHLAFAFPLVYRMLALFSLTNRRLLALVTLCCFLVYALFYVLVYRATSRAYYAIVSGGREEAP